MSVYKMIEIVGTSKESFADATRNGIKRASRKIRDISWFEVKEQRGTVVDGDVGEFQVKIHVGFKLED